MILFPDYSSSAFPLLLLAVYGSTIISNEQWDLKTIKSTPTAAAINALPTYSWPYHYRAYLPDFQLQKSLSGWLEAPLPKPKRPQNYEHRTHDPGNYCSSPCSSPQPTTNKSKRITTQLPLASGGTTQRCLLCTDSYGVPRRSKLWLPRVITGFILTFHQSLPFHVPLSYSPSNIVWDHLPSKLLALNSWGQGLLGKPT